MSATLKNQLATFSSSSALLVVVVDAVNVTVTAALVVVFVDDDVDVAAVKSSWSRLNSALPSARQSPHPLTTSIILSICKTP